MRSAIYFYICLGILFPGCSEETIYKVGIHGSLEGTLNGFANSKTTALADAEVVFEGSQPLVTVRTDSQGKYVTGELTTGTYNLVFTKDGYGTFKIPGFSFVGGDNTTYMPAVTLYKLPTLEIKDATVTVNRFLDTIAAGFTLFTDTDDTTPAYGVFRYFLSTDANVSPTNYRDTGTAGGYSQSGAHSFTLNFSAKAYPVGTSFYVVFYPSTSQSSSYLDVDTGNDVFPTLGKSKSAILKITVPN